MYFTFYCVQKQGHVKTQAQIAPAAQGPITLQLPVSAAGSSMQQIQVPGSKFHYVRLVSPSTHTSGIFLDHSIELAFKDLTKKMIYLPNLSCTNCH